MKFTYIGPHDAVDLPGVGNDIKPGDEVEVTGEAAKSLDAQADWQRVDKPKTRNQQAESATNQNEE